MQYLLSEAEYESLKHLAQVGREAPKENELQAFCTRVANEMPIRWTWGEGRENPKPWGCIITKKSEWYCDQCPAQELCPCQQKEWSK